MIAVYLLSLILAVAGIGIFIKIRRDQIREGELKKENEVLKGAQEALTHVKQVHDRIDYDPDFARRVRDRFNPKP